MEKLTKYVIPLLLTVFIFVACGNTAQTEISDIEDNVWTMRTIQDTHTGKIIACDRQFSESFIEAETLDVILSANDGVIEIYDGTNNSKYYIDYKFTGATHTSRNYSLSSNTAHGYAVISYTETAYEKISVLIISIGGYTVNFYAK